MNWNQANSLQELTICPNCNAELDIGNIETTKSGRKRINCSCGCRIYESTERIWFCIPQEIRTNNNKIKGYYEQYKN